jgi:iron complex transport system ATP-binding protein
MKTIPVIACNNLILGYKDKVVIDSVDLEVSSGEFVALLGPNASGKSTLLRGLSGIRAIDAGELSFSGQESSLITPRELAKRVAFLPQSPPTDLDLTVRELVSRGRSPYLSRFTVTDSETTKYEVDRAIKSVGVESLAERPLGSLSGGEAQRAWISFALVKKPQILMLDEPTSHLDIMYQRDLMRLLRELCGDGLAVIVVLHDISLALAHCDRVIGLDQGKIMFDGDVRNGIEPSLRALSEIFKMNLVSLPSSAGTTLVAPDWNNPED